MILSTDIVGLLSNQDVFCAIKEAKSAGFDGIDFPFNYVYNNIPCPITGEDYLGYAQKLFDCASSLGVKFSQAHAPIPTYDFNATKAENDKKFNAIVRSIEMCEIMQAPYLVVHPVDCRGQGVNEFEFNLNLLKSFTPYLKGKKVKLALENVYGGNAKAGISITPNDTPELLLKYAEALPSEYFVICLDTGHAITAGYSPAEFIRKLGDKIKLLHAHDGKIGQDMHTLPYLAEVDWESVINALKTIGFNGDFSFETFRFDKLLPIELRKDALSLKCKLGRYFIKRLSE